jgi:hypothetical protein
MKMNQIEITRIYEKKLENLELERSLKSDLSIVKMQQNSSKLMG